MVIDSSKGVEERTLKLLEVCRARNTPIITFMNKMDREVRAPLDLLHEIESILMMTAAPFTWPIGMGKTFGGVADLRSDQVRVFKGGEDRRQDDEEVIEGLENPALFERFDVAYAQAHGEIELLRSASPEFDFAEFLTGHQTPVFFGSAVNNFGVREVRDALIDLAPPPGPKPAIQREVQPIEEKFTGVVFKIQANMDPAHRDRIAFVRVASGRFTRDMKLVVSRTGKSLRTSSAVSFLSQRRDLLDEAYAGDILGIPNRGALQLGDTLTEGEALQFTGLPFFAPELFHEVEVADPLRFKQLRTGLQQLGEEGAIQVFRPHHAGPLLLGAAGALQFEVVAHRLEHEYNARARMQPSKYKMARWITSEVRGEVDRFITGNAHRVAYDVVDAPAVLIERPYELKTIAELWPNIKLHTLREHAGLVFHSHLAEAR